MTTDPHQNCPVPDAGVPLKDAQLVVLAAHGRYGVASDILKLADQVNNPHTAWIAPQAEGRSWWGDTFLAPLCSNEPGLSSALRRFSAIMDELSQMGFGPEKIILAGFSQGACLILEHAARYPKPWLGLVAMSGGLIGTAECDAPPCEDLNGHVPKRFDYDGRLDGVPVHIGCHVEDPVIPVARVRKSKSVLENMGAKVDLHEESGGMHSVLPSDIAALKHALRRNAGAPRIA